MGLWRLAPMTGTKQCAPAGDPTRGETIRPITTEAPRPSEFGCPAPVGHWL